MPVRVAINGFGRIGRCLARLIIQKQELELVAVNSRADTERDVHLLRYDSVHGRFPGTVEAREETLYLNGKEVHITRVLQPQS